MDFLKEAQAIEGKMISFREDIHEHPELGNHEKRTTEKIIEVLHSMDIETEQVLSTGVIGILHGNRKGRRVAFRSDIDALPVKEETGLPYASKTTGVMHACGHDMHMAALLGAAKILSDHRGEIPGTVVLIFQPDEEGDGGAERIMNSGVLDELDVDTVYGAHVEPSLPCGTIGVKYGQFYANALKYDIHVQGKGTHAAQPENGTDSLCAAAQMVVALKKLNEENNDGRCVCTTGCFQAGTIRNIISDHADFSGILRSTTPEMRKAKAERIRKTVEQIAEDYHVHVTCDLVMGYPGVINHDENSLLVEETAENLLGKDHVVIEKKPTMTTEDFGYYIEKYKGCFYHIGVNSPYPLHSPKMCPDEHALATAAAVHAAVLMNDLKKENL